MSTCHCALWLKLCTPGQLFFCVPYEPWEVLPKIELLQQATDLSKRLNWLICISIFCDVILPILCTIHLRS